MPTRNNTLAHATPADPTIGHQVFTQICKMGTAWSWKKKLLAIALPVVALTSFIAVSQTTPPNIPAITLSADPLYTPAAVDKPALALALSVEYPTVGAQYVDPDNNNNSTTDDVTYSPTIEYLGYYDAESCYTYDDAGTSAPAGQTSAYKRFVRRGPALPLSTPNTSNPTWTSRMCWNGTKSYSKDDGTFSTTTNDAFSGNFLNWASSSAIDMLRLSLTGGDRVIDLPNLTVLQRAMIPDGDPVYMGNSSNFPAKRLYRNGTSRAITSANFASASYVSGVPYFGAVPKVMADAATAATSTGDIFVANTLNRIYFGTTKSGNNSTSFSSYTLGIDTSGSQIGPVTHNPFATRQTGINSFNGTSCASENGTCSFSGKKEVLYGSSSSGGGWITFLASGGAGCNNNVTGSFIDPAPGAGKVCYYRDYPGTNTWTPTVSAGALNTDGYFFARVEVCNRDDTTYALKDKRYWNLCTQYSDGATTPHAAFKPTGAIQKYSDQLRLAAFGYLMDPSDSRYGGVLRAPIKYVGAKTFDINGVDNTPSGGNPNREWDTVTGVFNTNPDNNTTVPTADGRATNLSGVIPYVNQFGRTGAVAGRYKTNDPIGELHYQAVRYLQGLQPSPATFSGITTDMYDGYPVYTTWTDPYGNGRSSTADYSCLKSNIVVIGDKNTHDHNSRLPTYNAANNIPDISYWETVAGKFESNTSGNYLDGAGIKRTIANPNTANTAGLTSASGNVSLVGSAYWAHTHDIRGTSWTNASATYTAGTALQRPGLRVKTFTFDVNEYGGSNDAANRRTSNQLFRAAKYGGFEADPSNTAKNPYNTYGNPFVNEQDGTNNNYVWADTDTRTSRVGEANTYFLQSDARGVLSAFDDIFARASTAARSIAGGAIQSKNLTQVGDTIYQGTFDTSDWSGDLLAIPVSVSTNNVVSIDNNTTWTASARLTAMAAADRKIVIGKAWAATSPNPVAVSFTWSDIAGEQGLIDSLNKTPTTSADGRGEARLNYLRGDRSNEGSLFRTRSKLMGDVINSGVVYSGAPSTSISDSGYSAFYNTNKNRTPAVFVGANDGMLHAFNGNTGDELFAYIPSWLGSKLSALTSTTYNNNHQSYLDGTPAVAEALLGSDWKTVLVSGTGGGGKGVFALDVTDPTNFTPTNVLWEFTNKDDADLGNVTGRPQILKIRTDTNTYKWFAVFGSGVNNYVTDNGVTGSGYPALFILDLSKPKGTAWSPGVNYYKISLPVNGTSSGTLSASLPTGLLNFRAALGTAKEVTYIFMGDLHGNFWKLDFKSAASTTDWNIGNLSYFNQGTTSSPIPMFIAKDTSDSVQPISAAPNIVFGPVANSFYVLFGTGKYLEVGDKATTTTQSVYMLYDNATTNVDSSPKSSAKSAISDRRRLKLGTANATTGVVTMSAFTVGRAINNTDSSNPRSGWVFDMPNSGERQISNGTIFGEKIVFGTLIPSTSSTNACSASGGGGNQYTIDIQTGNGTSIGSSVGILGEPLVAEISSATTYTASDSTGRRIKTITSQVFQQGANGVAAGSGGSNTNTLTRTVVTGRITWRQINNYQDLKNATP
jgi:type IV pilus assembly protein PilY1